MVPGPTNSRRTGTGTTLADGIVVAAPDGQAAQVADLLAAELGAATGWSVRRGGPDATSPAGTISLAVQEAAGPTTVDAGPRVSAGGWPENYRLQVDGAGVQITAPSAAGLFYGTRTLRQLLPAHLLRCAPSQPVRSVALDGWDIEDSPRFGWRGLGLDVARHFFPKSFLLKLIDVAAFHKFNVLHLHLTDDQGWRLPVEGYPLLTQVGAWRRGSPLGHERENRWDDKPHGGYYSKADLAEVIAYAARRFVTVVPEVDMPGHMQAAIASYPELGNTGDRLEVYTRWGISDHVLNMEEATVRFCADVLQEVMTIFPGPYVHIGGDECPTTEWAASPRAQARCQELGLNGVGQLQAWFTSRMAEVVSSGGRQLVAWDEIVEAGAPPGTLIMFWRYDHDPTVPVRAARQGLDVVMAPEPWSYFDWSYTSDPREPLAIRGEMSVEKAYSSEPVQPEVAAAGLARHILGVEAELWTEYVATPEQAEYMCFPRACATAEVGWSRRPREWAEFSTRLAAHTERLDALGVNYRPLDGPNPGQARTWAPPADR